MAKVTVDQILDCIFPAPEDRGIQPMPAPKNLFERLSRVFQNAEKALAYDITPTKNLKSFTQIEQNLCDLGFSKEKAHGLTINLVEYIEDKLGEIAALQAMSQGKPVHVEIAAYDNNKPFGLDIVSSSPIFTNAVMNEMHHELRHLLKDNPDYFFIVNNPPVLPKIDDDNLQVK